MPPPFRVDLVPYDPQWAAMTQEESSRLMSALGEVLLEVHHIGSTAIAGILAKPILDLLPVVPTLQALDERREQIEELGYEWWGELGLPGRRYCTLSDPVTGSRLIQLHGYAVGSPEIDRHLAFRDYLRHRPDLARLYEQEKLRCQALHPDDSHAYTDCKSPWVVKIEAEALAWQRASSTVG